MRGERGRRRRPLIFAVLLLTSHLSPLTSQAIQDNSFLLEEAYNQESGVVQHISAFQRADDGDWAYSFTQEWPFGGIRHQLSYTVPIQHTDPTGTGLGDIALNYRYQLAGNPSARTVMAPRLSLVLPTGNDQLERGTGGLGFQGDLPVTLVLSRSWVSHWNAGTTITPTARNGQGEKATTTDFNLGASLVWLLRPSFNLLVETLWLSEQFVEGEGHAAREESAFISPGFRIAFNLAGGLQIVPGVAYSIGVAPKGVEDSLFIYLSFEHPFKRQ
jgi:outer membrane putative beta-barrel porin/alpha-amylase